MSNQKPPKKMENLSTSTLAWSSIIFLLLIALVISERERRNLEFKYSLLQDLIKKNYPPWSIVETIIKTPFRLINSYLQGRIFSYFYNFIGTGDEHGIGEYIYDLNNSDINPKKKTLLTSALSKAVAGTSPDFLADIVLKAIDREIINKKFDSANYVIEGKPFQYEKEVKDYFMRAVLNQGNASAAAISFLETIDNKIAFWVSDGAVDLSAEQRTLLFAEQIKIHKFFNRPIK